MEASAPLRVDVKLLEHVLRWFAGFDGEVEGHVLEIEVTCDVERRTTQTVLLDEHLKDIILVELFTILCESFHDLSQHSSVHHGEDTCAIQEIFRSQSDR